MDFSTPQKTTFALILTLYQNIQCLHKSLHFGQTDPCRWYYAFYCNTWHLYFHCCLISYDQETCSGPTEKQYGDPLLHNTPTKYTPDHLDSFSLRRVLGPSESLYSQKQDPIGGGKVRCPHNVQILNYRQPIFIQNTKSTSQSTESGGSSSLDHILAAYKNASSHKLTKPTYLHTSHSTWLIPPSRCLGPLPPGQDISLDQTIYSPSKNTLLQ